jgi:hypothetical protein
MIEVWRLLISLALAGAALTLLGGGVIWSMDETRRIRRSLTRVLGEAPHAIVVARGRGKGVGFNFTSNQVAVAWDAGAWCLIYRLDELVGAELAVDGQVLARVYRGEPRRALDLMRGADTQVRLRLIFDEPRNPDFVLDLWLPEDETRKGAMTAAEAIQEANRWIARVESLLRRPVPTRPAPGIAAPPAAPKQQPARPAQTVRADPAPEPPPWEDDEPEALS